VNRADRRAAARRGLLPSGFYCPHCEAGLPPLLDRAGYVEWLAMQEISRPVVIDRIEASFWACTVCHASGIYIPPEDAYGPAEWPGLD
jgi:hypothetical protein